MMIIDIHGHYTTAPDELAQWRQQQIAALDGGAQPPAEGPEISDDAIRESIESNQLKLMDQRGIDLTVLSPRASFMAHHVGDRRTSAAWARVCNDLCARVSQLYPQRFAPAIMLPQSPGAEPAGSVAELERGVQELGVVAVNLSPDPSGGYWSSPPLTDQSWYPIYQKLVEHQLPAMIHVSTSANPAFHTTGAHYLNADTTAFMQLLEGDLFRDFPDLKLVIPHGGGAVPYHWGRFRGLGIAMDKPDIQEHLMRNVYFDTCVYHQPGINELFEVIKTENILFASEMIGAVRDIDPATGQYFDDTVKYVNALNLETNVAEDVFARNALRVYPRLAEHLKAAGIGEQLLQTLETTRM